MTKKIFLAMALGMISFLTGCGQDTPSLDEQITPQDSLKQAEVIHPIKSEVINDSITVVPTSNTSSNKLKNTTDNYLESKQGYQNVSTTLAIATDFSFSRCDTRWQFKASNWYKDLVDVLIANTRANEKNIAQICVSADQSLAIIMLNGDIQNTGGIVRYQINHNKLDQAEFTIADDFPLHLYRLGRRVGTIIPLYGGLKTENCQYYYRLNYEFAKNIVEPLEECQQCSQSDRVCRKF